MVNGYLLDTNQVSKLLDNHPSVVNRVASVGISKIFTSAIVCGELVFMARHSRHKVENLDKVSLFIRQITVLPIDTETSLLYGEIKENFLKRFGPKSLKERAKFPLERIGLRDNDLWIAATAIKHDLTLVSADKDFGRIREVHDFNLEAWWTPEP
jgi:tRNA(fMet)-specific endonuclease VapC